MSHFKPSIAQKHVLSLYHLAMLFLLSWFVQLYKEFYTITDYFYCQTNQYRRTKLHLISLTRSKIVLPRICNTNASTVKHLRTPANLISKTILYYTQANITLYLFKRVWKHFPEYFQLKQFRYLICSWRFGHVQSWEKPLCKSTISTGCFAFTGKCTRLVSLAVFCYKKHMNLATSLNKDT